MNHTLQRGRISEANEDGHQWWNLRRDLIALTLGFGALFFLLLGRPPLANPDEARYAEIPREMLVSGDWITPRLNGVDYFEKPPLVYWAIAGAMKLFGQNEWAIRAIPALAALSGVLLLYIATRRLVGRAAGVAAASVLGLSLFYVIIARIVLLDMVVTVFISATLLCFILGVREPAGPRRRALFYGLYVSAALATLTKGLIGFLLPGAVMFLWLLLFDQWRRLRPLYLPTGAVVFLAITVPWHVLIAQRNPTWAQFYFVHEHWERFTTTTHGRVRPWWFFAPLVTLGLFPTLGFTWSALRDSLAGGWAKRRESALAGFFVIWAIFVFLFFSKSQSKLPPYVLPVFPPLAALTGIWLAQQWSSDGRRFRLGVIVFAVTAALLAGLMNVAVLNPQLSRMPAAQAHVLRPFALISAIVLVGGSAAVLAFRRRPRLSLISIGVTTTLAYITFAIGGARFEPSGTSELARYARATLPPGARIFHYHDFFHDFVFYAKRFVGTVDFHGDEMELVNDAPARASGRFIDESTFRALWDSDTPVFVVMRKQKLADIQANAHPLVSRLQPSPGAAGRNETIDASAALTLPVFADPTCTFRVLRESADHLLITNLPRISTPSD
jgi:4-amino-4-deoxy-L-arabinose transferase-like glycosyltransferase